MEEAIPKRASIRDDAINLPNLLTMLRIALIPGVLFLLWEGTPKSNFWAAILYIGTALTDLIDGYRKGAIPERNVEKRRDDAEVQE